MKNQKLGPSKGLLFAIEHKLGEEMALKMILSWCRNLEGELREKIMRWHKNYSRTPAGGWGGIVVRCVWISIEIPVAHELVSRWMGPPHVYLPHFTLLKGTLRRER